MIRIKRQEGLTFDDVILEPQKSSFGSRFNGEVDLSVELLPKLKLKYPIISANMDTVTGASMANTMRELGGLGIIHRFLNAEDHQAQLEETFNDKGMVILCVGVGSDKDELLSEYRHQFDGVLIDIAHGHSDLMVQKIQRVKSIAPSLPIIAGNVATADGAIELVEAGASCIKVGVGPGSLCTTRIKTGCGVPQLSAIIEVEKAIRGEATVIADGGIRHSGDIIKSLAAGADAVMIGRLFAGTDEAPGQVMNVPGQGKVKVYRGMASKEAQESWKGKATSIEGEIAWVSYKGRVADVFHDLISGMKSGMSYQNARNIEELRENAVFIKQTSAGILEAQPHALIK
jgi:IMP dehydrogenase